MKKISAYTIFYLLAVAAAVAVFSGTSRAKVYINISAARIRKIRIAVPDFKNVSAYGQHKKIEKNAAEIIRHDLSVIGYFHVVNPLSYLENAQFAPMNPGKIDYSDWSILNAEYLVNCEYATSNGFITVKGNLISVYSKKLLFSEKIKGADGQYRYLANKFADDILKFLTGKEGPFTTRVFFVGESGDSKNIYAMNFGGHRVKKITSGNSINIFPSPNPNGTKVAYISFRDGAPAVFITNLKNGGTVRLNLSGPADFVSWSPQGNKLAVALTSDYYNTEIYTVDTDGGNLKKLTSTEGINTSPSFSPDGSMIAFVSNRGGSPQIYTMNSDGTDQQRITFNEGNYNTSPAWSPDGKMIAFTSLVNGALQVFIMNSDGSGERQVTNTPYSANHPAWTRDSRILSFDTEVEGRQELYMIDVNESGMMRLLPRIFPALHDYKNAGWTINSSY